MSTRFFFQRRASRWTHSKRSAFAWLFAASLAVGTQHAARAQLVADGQTRILDAVTTNILGNLTIGTNGSFTLLVLTNGAAVTNTFTTMIGANASALSNRVTVTGAGSFLGNSNFLGDVRVGDSGSFNELDVLNGGAVVNKGSSIGFNSSSKSNLAVIANPGSSWSQAVLQIGASGAANQLVISNGGKVMNVTGTIGGTVSASNNLVIVTGSGSLWSNSITIYVGNAGARNSLLVTNGATVIGGADYLGNTASSGNNTATVAGSGSVWRDINLNVPYTGGGPSNRLVIAAGGAVFNSNYCVIGSYSSSNSVLVTGPGSRLTNSQYIQVGVLSRGNELVVSNGGVVATGNTYVENNGGARQKVVVTGTGSLLTNSADFYLGQMGSSNLLIVNDGAKLVDNIGYIGYGAFQRANAAVVSLATWSNRSDLYVGNGSSASQLLLTNAGQVIANSTYIGNTAYSSNNLVVVSDIFNFFGRPPLPSILTNRQDLYLGYSGSFNQLFVTNGGVVANNIAYVGYSPSSGTNKIFVADTGSVWQCRSFLFLGYAGKGNQLVVSNGGTVTASSLLIGNSTFNASNQVVVAGGNILLSSSLSIYYGTLTLNSGLLNASTLSLSAAGQAKVVFNGGTLQTRTTSDPIQTIAVGNGTNAAVFEMLLNGTHSFAGGLIIRSNATLKGVGLISGNVTNQNGGTISPGSSIAQISVNGSLVFLPGSTNVMDLNANTAASDSFVDIANVTYGGTLQLNNLAGSLADGNSFTLYTATNYAGAFDRVLPHAPGPGLRWNLARLTVDGVLQVVATTPSPPPLISGTALSAGNLVITGGNGVPYDPCVLLSSTNLAAPIGDWTPWVTNYFDGYGTVVFTKPILPGEPGRYFRLKVE